MDAIQSYLPKHGGILPIWLLVTSLAAIGNCFQAYTTLYYTQRLYNGRPPPRKASAKGPKHDISHSPATPLSARTMGTWNLIQAIVRLYGAYYIHDPVIYQMVQVTYLVAGWHFLSEWLIFKSTGMSTALFFPVTVATTSTVWMFLQSDFYLH